MVPLTAGMILNSHPCIFLNQTVIFIMTLHTYIKQHTHDAVLWLSINQWQQASNAIAKHEAIKYIVDLLLAIANQAKRETYTKSICDRIKVAVKQQQQSLSGLQKQYKSIQKLLTKDPENPDLQAELSKIQQQIDAIHSSTISELNAKDLARYIKLEQDERIAAAKEKQKNVFNAIGDATFENDDDGWSACPAWLDVKQAKEHGFSPVRDFKDGKIKRLGYYGYNPAEKQHSEITNFTIQPIFHIKAGKESRFLIQVDNGYKTSVLDLDSKSMYSIEAIQGHLVGEGNYYIFGSKLQFLRVASKLMQDFRECFEIKSLGWQRYGFYAFVNGIYVPGSGMHELDEWGVYELEKQHYLIPAASAVYKKLNNTEDDPYENDRPMTHISSNLPLNKWCALMQRVYGNSGTTGIAYCFLTAFRDIAFSIDNNFPHLYAFGERSSGKSKWAESLSRFFFNNRTAFNLNSGTDFAFFSYMGRFKNAIATLNEFDEQVIRDDWFQSIKGIFDGESRQRGSMTSRNKVEIMKVESGIMLIGQFLVTKDDNSVVTRSIIESFSERNLTKRIS
jgi:hypothetical protein